GAGIDGARGNRSGLDGVGAASTVLRVAVRAVIRMPRGRLRWGAEDQIPFRLVHEAVTAAGAAEMVGLAGVHRTVAGGRDVDTHAADWVDCGPGVRRNIGHGLLHRRSLPARTDRC